MVNIHIFDMLRPLLTEHDRDLLKAMSDASIADDHDLNLLTTLVEQALELDRRVNPQEFDKQPQLAIEQ